MAEWKAEIAVSEALARNLLTRQFPQLQLQELRPFGEGWDNTVFLVNGEWIFRFPRRQVAIAGVETEMRILPRLAALLPLPIPKPEFLGQPSPEYPWPFFGGRWVSGRELPELALSEAQRIRLAKPLARFLEALHAPAVFEALGNELRVDPVGRGNMSARVPMTETKLRDVEQLGLWRAPAEVPALLREAAKLPIPPPASVVHGDLHFRHLLLDDAGDLRGVIDWGDLHAGDPAVDLQLYWSLLPPAGRAEFLREYGPIPEDRLLRARVLALFLGAALASYGHQERMPAVKREALWSLDNTLRHPPDDRPSSG
jgi:aminoglycoside phosphotransferase (APT) family kinase protein